MSATTAGSRPADPASDRRDPASDRQRDSGDRPGLLDRVKAGITALRRRSPLVDHAVRMVEHMGAVQGTILAGAVTYFGYLSFFPVLVIGFTVVAYIAAVVPDAQNSLVLAVESIFPGLIGTDDDDAINVDEFQGRAGAIGVVALVGLLYTGLGWISAARAGIQRVFEVPQEDRRNFVVGKGIDLIVLAVIGTVLLLSVGLSSAVTNVTEDLLLFFGVDNLPGPTVTWPLRALGVALGVSASTVLFFTMFVLLPTASLPRSAVLKGAFVAALGFEVLKLLASKVIGLAAGNPATAVLGISLVLLVWINYFSRVVMVGAAWAYTSPEARRIRERQDERQRTRAELAARRRRRRERYGSRRRAEAAARLDPVAQRRVDRLSVAAGATVGVTAAAVVTALRRRR